MRTLVLLFLAIALQDQPTPGHGPYANQEGVKCYRGETRDLRPNPANVKKLIHCDCKMQCDEHGTQSEAGDCQTYCDNNKNSGDKQCQCHNDEACH